MREPSRPSSETSSPTKIPARGPPRTLLQASVDRRMTPERRPVLPSRGNPYRAQFRTPLRRIPVSPHQPWKEAEPRHLRLPVWGPLCGSVFLHLPYQRRNRGAPPKLPPAPAPRLRLGRDGQDHRRPPTAPPTSPGKSEGRVLLTTISPPPPPSRTRLPAEAQTPSSVTSPRVRGRIRGGDAGRRAVRSLHAAWFGEPDIVTPRGSSRLADRGRRKPTR